MQPVLEQGSIDKPVLEQGSIDKPLTFDVGLIIDSRVQGLETDHVHTFALYIEPSAVNIAPFNTSYYHFPGYTTAGREVVQRLESLSSRQQVMRRS